jgi:capsule biosynthesis phosphatase
MPKQQAIDWVICAAGSGSRFAKQEITTAKPNIMLKGKSFLERSLQSLDILPGDKVIIIVQKNDKVIKQRVTLEESYPFVDIQWIELKKQTSGQLSTYLKALPYLSPGSSVAIWNCDTYFKASGLRTLMQDSSIDGIVPCGKMKGEHWSFFDFDNQGNLCNVAEKKRVSQWASVGLYFFRDAKTLTQFAKKLTKSTPEKRLGEHYVSSVYKSCIEKGLRVVNCPVSHFLPFGTPEDVKKYWKTSRQELLNQNPRGTLVVDLDNTITIDEPTTSYPNKNANLKLIKKLHEYRNKGFRIVIYTARNMRTQKGDESQVVANIGKATLDWLEKYNVPYDGLKFGKPFAENTFYVDDKAIRPDEFLKLPYEELLKKVK